MKTLFTEIKTEFQKYKDLDDPVVVQIQKYISELEIYFEKRETDGDEIDNEFVIELLSHIDLDFIVKKESLLASISIIYEKLDLLKSEIGRCMSNLEHREKLVSRLENVFCVEN